MGTFSQNLSTFGIIAGGAIGLSIITELGTYTYNRFFTDKYGLLDKHFNTFVHTVGVGAVLGSAYPLLGAGIVHLTQNISNITVLPHN